MRVDRRWDVTDEDGNTLIDYAVCDTTDPYRKGCYPEFTIAEKYVLINDIKDGNKKTGKITDNEGKIFYVRPSPKIKFLF